MGLAKGNSTRMSNAFESQALVPVPEWSPRSFGLPSRSAGKLLAFGTLIFAVAAGVCLAFLPDGERQVALPSLAVAAGGCLFLLALTEMNLEAPAGEIGAYYVAAIMLYALIPLLGYLFRGMTFTVYNDPRLSRYHPSPADMGTLGWLHAAYLLAFAVTYLWVRGRRLLYPVQLSSPAAGTFKVALIAGSAMQIFLYVYSLFYGVQGETYVEQVKASAAMAATVPLWLLQVASHMSQAVLTLKMLILVLLFMDYRRYRIAIWIWLTVETVLSVSRLGARSPLVFLLITTVFLYHRQARPLRFWRAGLLLVAGLAAYQSFGLVRSFGSFDIGAVNILTGPGEFESHLGTGFDVMRRKNLGSLPPVPIQVYFADFLALIPSQVLPFPKWTGASWYLDVLKMKNLGYGFTFGSIAEAAIGFGWPDLMLRGALLGVIFALMHRFYIRRSDSFWVTALYIYLVVNSYNSFRSSTFYWVATLWLQVIPVYIVIRLLSGRQKA